MAGREIGNRNIKQDQDVTGILESIRKDKRPLAAANGVLAFGRFAEMDNQKG